MQVASIPYGALERERPEPPYVLLKTARTSSNHRWSILGWDPAFVWAPVNSAAPLQELDALVSQFSSQTDDGRRCWLRTTDDGIRTMDDAVPVPILMGALSYDLGRTIEEIPATASDPWHGLQAVMYAFRKFHIMDEVTHCGWEATVGHCERSAAISQSGWEATVGHCERSAAIQSLIPCDGNAGLLRYARNDESISSHKDASMSSRNDTSGSHFTRRAYMNAVARIRDMIAAGDCYQINLSQQFTQATKRTAADLFAEAVAQNPAPMMGLIDTGAFQIISTSPERLIQRRGARLVAQPIKGTIARGSSPEDDRSQREALLSSAKDRAELAMIIDLVRNDLGRVSQAGSVRVVEPYGVESYTNVHHLVATIEGNLIPETTWGAILRAVFPGGSITGCPKIQAMRVIEALEGVRRGFYCGSLGYIDGRGDGDFNIAIRTMTKQDTQVIYNVGGAVVFDSDPELEYEETLMKGETLRTMLTENELRIPSSVVRIPKPTDDG